MATRSPVSVSPDGPSSDAYQAQPNGAVSNKNTYRHMPGHAPMVNNIGYQQFAPGSIMPYPASMAVPNGQFYPAPVGPNGYVPAYPHGPGAVQEPPYYYYPPQAAWAMHGSVPMYTPQAYGTSPPSTPPQAQIPYGYPMMHPGTEYYNSDGRILPPSPPQINYNTQNVGHGVPPLDNRRSSWSSSGASDSPATPFMPQATAEPAIVGEPYIVSNVSYADHGGKPVDNGKKKLESLLLSGPPLPRAIPAVYSPDAPKTMGQCLENPTNTTNVYIRGLPPDTDDDKLLEMTSRFGVVTSHKAIMDTEHGTCKGYGFARYETQDQAETCIRGLVSMKYEAGFARESFNARLKTLADPNSTNVYVSNLPRSMNEKDMQDIFKGYVVVSNRILRDVNGNSRGVGFARFESRDICDEIIRKFHTTPVGEERLQLQVRYADTSAQKRLKATTTKKRQFRSNEYNSYINGNYYAHPVHYAHPAQHKNRVWMRQVSNLSNISNDSGVALPVLDQNSPPATTKKTWDKSQTWKTNGAENRPDEWKPVPWRSASAMSRSSKNTQLESVSEDSHNDEISETQSEVTTVPAALENNMRHSVSRSTGTLSDPGDSYGGREK